MGVAVINRPEHDYADMAFAIKCMETGEARQLRENADVNKNEMARRIGVPAPYIQRWESGGNRPVLRNLDALAAYGRELRKFSQLHNDG